jgi:hypothetical protein
MEGRPPSTVVGRAIEARKNPVNCRSGFGLVGRTGFPAYPYPSFVTSHSRLAHAGAAFMRMNKRVIIGLLSAGMMAVGGCAHKAVKQDAAAAEEEKAKAASAAADAKRFQEVMDLLHKLKEPAGGAASTSASEAAVPEPVPAAAGKAPEAPKAAVQESGGKQ